MKLHITVTGSAPFTVEVEKDITVGEFKEMITTDSHFPKTMTYDSIRIIHFGKFLEDDEKTLEDYKVNEGGRIIVYVQKKAAPPPPPKPAPEEPTADTKKTEDMDNDRDQELGGGSSNTGTGSGSGLSAQPAAQPAAPVPAPAPSIVGPQVDPGKLEQLRAMGFPELEARKALAASRGNIEMAVDYIISGNIPDVPAEPAGGMGAGNIAAPMGISQAEVDQLMAYLQETDPEMYTQVRSNPALLPQLLQQAGIIGQLPAVPAGGFGFGGGSPAVAPGAGAGAVGITLNDTEQIQVQQICEITGLDAERVKVIFVRLGRSPDATCDIIFEYGDRFRALTPSQIDVMFLQMQRSHMGPGGAGAGGAGGAYRYDSDDDDDSTSSESNGSDEDNGGDDDDFYL